MTASSDPARSVAWASALSATTTVACVLPAYLAGALAVQIGDELGFDTAGLGIAVAAFWTANAATSVPLGHVADRWGARLSIRVAAATVAMAALAVAAGATRWWHLVALLAICGVTHALGHPAANSLLVSAVRPDRLGLAFGLKGAAPPSASMLAGFSVPVIALTVGWRWAFVAAAALAIGVLISARRRSTALASRPRRASGPLRDRGTVVMLAAAFGLATAASTAVTVFYVDAAVSAGTAPSLAGAVLAAGSLGAISARVVTGAISDRMSGRHFEACALTLLAGGTGIILLATAKPLPMAIGVVVAMAGTWGFQSMFWYRLVRTYRDVPGRITGAIQPGSAIGGAVGPLVFGFLAERSYGAAWTTVGCVTLVAAAMMFMAARRPSAEPTGSPAPAI